MDERRGWIQGLYLTFIYIYIPDIDIYHSKYLKEKMIHYLFN